MLRGLSPPDNELGIESHIEGLQQWSLVLLRTGRVHESLQVTQDLAALCERKGTERMAVLSFSHPGG